MKTNALFIFFILLIVQICATAEEISIVDVRRNITLSDEDLIYKDFYLNAGEGAGLKKNLVVLVKRKIFVKDQSTKSVGDFETMVGQLRIIHVEGKVAVGREYKLQSRDDFPMLEQIGMMSGDRIDLTGAFTDNAQPVKRKVTAIEPISPDVKPTEVTQTASVQIEITEDVKTPVAPIAPSETKREPATPRALAPQPMPEI